jgi:hypothetical protein
MQHGRETQQITGVHALPSNTAPESNHTAADQSATPPPPTDNLETLKQWHIKRLLDDNESG